MKRKFSILCLLFSLGIVFVGCSNPFPSSTSKEGEGRMKPGNYVAVTDKTGVIPPSFSLEGDTFTMSYNIARDYLPNGNFTVKDGKLTARDKRTGEVFTFQIVNGETLKFLPEESSFLEYRENSGMSDLNQGLTFLWQSEE